MKHASIVLCHYSKIDDFGQARAGINPPKRSSLLRKCVQSILNNTNYPAELIVMDNGGNPDDSNYLLKKAREGKLTHVRFPQNMHYAFAWNTGAKMATGHYLCFMCNDIEVAKNWLNQCVRILEEHSKEKIIAIPLITRDKRRLTTILQNGDRLNPRAGSSCLVIKRKDFYTIGQWPHHTLGGSMWYNKLANLGYKFIAPPADLVQDMGWKRGLNLRIPIQVKKTLLDGSEIHFEEK